jgi:uncharacterized membrane protein
MAHSNPEPSTPSPGYGPGNPAPAPKRRRRIFPWVFLAIQAIFLIWIITGVSSSGGTKDCGTLTAQQCADAAHVGTGIGVALIIGLWVAVDIILGITYLILRLSRRR